MDQEWLNSLMWKNTPEWKKNQLREEQDVLYGYQTSENVRTNGNSQDSLQTLRNSFEEVSLSSE